MAKKYREVRSALATAGWEVLRQRGSHEVWGKHGGTARIVVAGKDSDTVPVGTLSSIRRQADWSICDERVHSGHRTSR